MEKVQDSAHIRVWTRRLGSRHEHAEVANRSLSVLGEILVLRSLLHLGLRVAALLCSAVSEGARAEAKEREEFQEVLRLRASNCSKSGHLAADCRAPRVEAPQRPGFNCGERSLILAIALRPKQGQL